MPLPDVHTLAPSATCGQGTGWAALDHICGYNHRQKDTLLQEHSAKRKAQGRHRKDRSDASEESRAYRQDEATQEEPIPVTQQYPMYVSFGPMRTKPPYTSQNRWIRQPTKQAPKRQPVAQGSRPHAYATCEHMSEVELGRMSWPDTSGTKVIRAADNGLLWDSTIRVCIRISSVNTKWRGLRINYLKVESIMKRTHRDDDYDDDPPWRLGVIMLRPMDNHILPGTLQKTIFRRSRGT